MYRSKHLDRWTKWNMSTIYHNNHYLVCSLFNLTPFFFLENLTVLKRKRRRRKRKRVKRRKRRAKRSRKRNKPRVRVHPAAHQTAVTAAATLRMRKPPERKPRRRAREEGTRPVTAALRESRRKNAPTVWTPNMRIQNTMSTEFRGHQQSTAERDVGTTKIDRGAGVENREGALSDGEMRKREVRRDTGARAGREGEREETGAENVTRARGKEKETLIEMSVGNEGGAVKNTAEVIAEMQRRGQNTAEGNSWTLSYLWLKDWFKSNSVHHLLSLILFQTLTTVRLFFFILLSTLFILFYKLNIDHGCQAPKWQSSTLKWIFVILVLYYWILILVLYYSCPLLNCIAIVFWSHTIRFMWQTNQNSSHYSCKFPPFFKTSCHRILSLTFDNNWSWDQERGRLSVNINFKSVPFVW